jgi:hypothetical protein
MAKAIARGVTAGLFAVQPFTGSGERLGEAVRRPARYG